MKARHDLLAGRPADAVLNYRLLAESGNGVNETLWLASAMIAAGQGRAALELLDQARQESPSGSTMARIELTAAKAAQSVSEFSLQVEYSNKAAEAAKKSGARILEGHASLNEGQSSQANW